jgi:tRNA(adenine34) deaminase
MTGEPTENDFKLMQRAVQLALQAESNGNLPIGAVISLGYEIVAEGLNSILVPEFNPSKHAEMNALDAVPVQLWARAAEMTCYSTLEPCCMCFGRLLLSGIGKIVFGANDLQGGSRSLTHHLPSYYSLQNSPKWIGPIMPEVCNPLFERAKGRYNEL